MFIKVVSSLEVCVLIVRAFLLLLARTIEQQVIRRFRHARLKDLFIRKRISREKAK